MGAFPQFIMGWGLLPLDLQETSLHMCRSRHLISVLAEFVSFTTSFVLECLWEIKLSEFYSAWQIPGVQPRGPLSPTSVLCQKFYMYAFINMCILFKVYGIFNWIFKYFIFKGKTLFYIFHFYHNTYLVNIHLTGIQKIQIDTLDLRL